MSWSEIKASQEGILGWSRFSSSKVENKYAPSQTLLALVLLGRNGQRVREQEK